MLYCEKSWSVSLYFLLSLLLLSCLDFNQIGSRKHSTYIFFVVHTDIRSMFLIHVQQTEQGQWCSDASNCLHSLRVLDNGRRAELSNPKEIMMSLKWHGSRILSGILRRDFFSLPPLQQAVWLIHIHIVPTSVRLFGFINLYSGILKVNNLVKGWFVTAQSCHKWWARL